MAARVAKEACSEKTIILYRYIYIYISLFACKAAVSSPDSQLCGHGYSSKHSWLRVSCLYML